MPDDDVKREDFGFLRIYSYQGLGAIFYRTFPPTEALVLEDLSLSSRLTQKEGESLLEKLISKSISITDRNLKFYDKEIDIKNRENINSFFNAMEGYLDDSIRKTLYNIKSVLGHRNIGEQSHLMISMVIPEISALTIQDEVFISSQERSTRYVMFRSMYMPSDLDDILRGRLSDGYESLSSTYNLLYDKLNKNYVEKFIEKNGRKPTEEEIKTVINPSVLDQIRGFLPLGALTSLVLQISSRTGENISRKLLSNHNRYNNYAGKLFSTVISDNVPSLSSHIAPDNFHRLIYDNERIKIDRSYLNDKPSFYNFDEITVSILPSSQTEEQIIDSISSQIANKGTDKYETVIDYLRNLSASRGGKYDDLNDSLLRSSFLQFEIKCSLGTARDLWRHRLANRSLSMLLNRYIIPDVIYRDDKLFETAKISLENLSRNISYLYDNNLASEAELLIPLSTEVSLNMSMSLAEAIFIAENRSTEEAHPEYKRIAFSIYDLLKRNYPTLLSNLKVFMGNEGLSNANDSYSRVKKPKVDEVNSILS